jgi:hypothetical protein
VQLFGEFPVKSIRKRFVLEIDLLAFVLELVMIHEVLPFWIEEEGKYRQGIFCRVAKFEPVSQSIYS